MTMTMTIVNDNDNGGDGDGPTTLMSSLSAPFQVDEKETAGEPDWTI